MVCTTDRASGFEGAWLGDAWYVWPAVVSEARLGVCLELGLLVVAFEAVGRSLLGSAGIVLAVLISVHRARQISRR